MAFSRHTTSAGGPTSASSPLTWPEGSGAAFAILTGASQIAVGRDCRASSPDIAGALIEGITGQGTSVLELGEVATDCVYYVSGSRLIPGVMVTASHNPAEYNGIKLCREGAAPVGEDTGLKEIERMVTAGIPPGPGGGTVTSLDAREGYVNHLMSVVATFAACGRPLDADGFSNPVCV